MHVRTASDHGPSYLYIGSKLQISDIETRIFSGQVEIMQCSSKCRLHGHLSSWGRGKPTILLAISLKLGLIFHIRCTCSGYFHVSQASPTAAYSNDYGIKFLLADTKNGD